MSLSCKVDLQGMSNWSKACGHCTTCLPTSKLHYPFERDLTNSFEFSNELKQYIEDNTDFKCVDTEIHKKPDLLILNDSDELVARCEAKFLEGKAFMKVNSMLADDMLPKETLVVDEPKLLSYFDCKIQDLAQYGKEIPIFVAWKYDRPCEDVGGITVFQEVSRLKEIYDSKGGTRKFTRRTARTDYQNGTRRGVIDKFHYSITECLPIQELVVQLNAL